MSDVLERFGPATQDWFRGAFAAPTAAQIGAWDAISHGKHALVVAPTGSGKTLSAFLWAIDRVFHEKDAAPPRHRGSRRRPRMPRPPPPASSTSRRSRRSASTSSATCARRSSASASPRAGSASRVPERDASACAPATRPRATAASSSPRRPTSSSRRPSRCTSCSRARPGETLTDVHTVIVDEVHAVAATKRGAHLAVSLERLDALARASPRSASASRPPCGRSTRSPGSSAARRRSRSWRRGRRRRSTCAVVVPVDDMLNPPPPPGADAAAGEPDAAADAPIDEDWFADGGRQRSARVAPSMTGSLWPHVEEAIVDRIVQHRSTIVFCNSRRLAERLTGRLNEIYSERLGLDASRCRPIPAAMMAQAGIDGRRRPGAREGAPRLGVEGAARAGRGGAEVRHPALRRRDQQPRARHRHGRRRPGDPGRGAAERRIRSAAHRPRRPPGRRGQPGGAVPQAPRRRAAHRDRHRADAGRADRGDLGAAEPARHPRAADRRRLRARPGRRRGLVRDASSAARRSARCPARPTRRHSICSPAASRPTSSPSCGRASSGTAITARSPGGPARSGSR